MKKLIPLVILLILLSTLTAAERDTLLIIHTTDVHGFLMDYNYFKDEPAEQGLVRVHTLVQKYRDMYDNVILLDGGDMIQGTPLSYLYNHVEKETLHPLIAAMNYMGYDAMAVGNHEIEQGLDVCNRLRSESDFPWLSANSKLENGYSFYEPYKIVRRNNLKIGIMGLTTPGIPKWIDSSIYDGIQWEDMVTTAAEYVAEVSSRCDLMIGLFHAGLEADGTDGSLPEENGSGLVSEQVPGFDIILGGHSHNSLPADTLTMHTSDPLELISGYHGKKAGVIRIILETVDNEVRIVEKR